MGKFFIEQIKQSNRYIDCQKLDITQRFGEFTEVDGRKQERVTITIELVGSGDTTNISNVAIIEAISNKLSGGVL